MAMRHGADLYSTNLTHPLKEKCRIKKENIRPFLSECLYMEPDRPKPRQTNNENPRRHNNKKSTKMW